MDNEIRKALEDVRCEEDLQASTLAYLAGQRQRRTQSAPAFSPRYFAPVLAALVLVICLFSFQYLQTPVAYVSIDINPSMELAVNRLGTVAFAEAYNDDGSRVLEGLRLKGLNMNDALDQILSSDTMRDYLTRAHDLTFTVAARDSRQEEQLLALIAQNPLCRQNRGVGYHGEMALVEPAHQAGMSMGKYCAYLELAQYDSSMTPEQCADMTMRQIHDCIRKHNEALPEDSAQETTHHESTHHSTVPQEPASQTSGNAEHSTEKAKHHGRKHH